MKNEIVKKTDMHLIYHQNFTKYRDQLLSGKTWVINGRVHVKDDLEGSPTLTIDNSIVDKIIVTKNGEIVTEKILNISEKDVISIEVKNENIYPKCIVTTDEQQLKAFIEIEPGYKLTRKIKNVLPARKIFLTLEEQKVITDKISVEKIHQALREANVLYGIREEVVIMASQAEEPLIYEIATGIPPQGGKDGLLEIKVNSEIQYLLKEDEKGNIDFRESMEIPIVKSGEILGIIHPPQPGNPGVSVANKPIQMNPLKTITLHLESGTELHENYIVATRGGRPRILQKNHIVKAAVIPKFVEKGNVNLSTGNIHFFGDIEVQGEVENNMTVEAGSNIMSYSSISNSTVTAGNSIISRGNVTNSILSVGEKNSVILQLSSYLKVITEQLNVIYEILSQVTQSNSYKNSQPKQSLKSIFKFLLQHRFNKFTDTAQKYINLIYQEKDFLMKEWQVTAEQLKHLLFAVYQSDITLSQVQLLLSTMQDIQDMTLLDFKERNIINIESISNSTLLCNGDIQIFGKGCLNSTVKSQGKVIIYGYLRGGSITAKNDIKVNIVGSTGGLKTVLSVPRGSKIIGKKAYEGTVLQIGHRQLTLVSMQENFTAYLNVKGNLVLA